VAGGGARHLTFRVALYYAPDLEDPLWTAGCSWLGRDPETGAALPQPDLPDIAEVTSEPRRYGFHCTLKPPMRLATSYAAFREEVEGLAASLRAFEMPPLAVADLSGFLAVREMAPSPQLHALADSCVAWVDRHRLPPDQAELARRRKHGISPEADALLRRWGYPGVFARWRFHMTLTRRLTPSEHDLYRPAAERFLADALARPRRVDAVCIFTQKEPGAPFLIGERMPFGN
jgi:hypothetical protein